MRHLAQWKQSGTTKRGTGHLLEEGNTVSGGCGLRGALAVSVRLAVASSAVERILGRAYATCRRDLRSSRLILALIVVGPKKNSQVFGFVFEEMSRV